MIKEASIDEVRIRMDTREVLEDFGVRFKNDKACCPFHGEKTASFHVKKSGNFYKCFGCGASGDGITAAMKLGSKTFIEAVQWLAEKYKISLEFDHKAVEEAEETKDARSHMLKLAEYAQTQFETYLQSLPDTHEVWKYLSNRGYDRNYCREKSIGYAPDEWKFLTTPIINMGVHKFATDMGLIRVKEGNSYDFYRNRITIPIHNATGQIVGFGGRWMPTGNEEQDKNAAKYFNPSESLIYSKDKTWFGLEKAMKAIKDEGFAYVQEGYFDVMSWQKAGAWNTVAACGTSITPNQIRQLKRYTSHAVLCLDGDKAGKTKQLKLINDFLAADFKVEVIELPNGQDPDEFALNFLTQNV